MPWPIGGPVRENDQVTGNRSRANGIDRFPVDLEANSWFLRCVDKSLPVDPRQLGQTKAVVPAKAELEVRAVGDRASDGEIGEIAHRVQRHVNLALQAVLSQLLTLSSVGKLARSRNDSRPALSGRKLGQSFRRHSARRWSRATSTTISCGVKELGLPVICVHDLRHTCATILLSKGVDPKIVQEMLGHG